MGFIDKEKLLKDLAEKFEGKYFEDVFDIYTQIKNFIEGYEESEEEKVNLKDYVFDMINFYDEEYAIEQGITELNNEDVNNIVFEILQHDQLRQIVQNEIEMYSGYKKHTK